MTVARLTPSDFDEVCGILREAHAESKYRSRPYDDVRAHQVIRAFLHSPKVFARGLFKDGQLVGLMLGEVTDSCWWSRELVAASLLIYVLPQHRGTGWLLLRSFLRWAKQSGAARANVGVTAGIKDALAGYIMNRVGLEASGIAFEKEF